MILTSSRARADGTADLLSDYDVIVAVRDADAFGRDDAWASGYGRPLVGWNDEHELYGMTTFFRGIVYEDGVKVDYTVWPDGLLRRVAEDTVRGGGLRACRLSGSPRQGRSDVALASGDVPGAHTRKTNAREARRLVDEFRWDTTYVAKSLWRGEIVFAKFMLDYDAKFVALRRFLDWRVEIDHDWGLRPGSHGRGLERLLPADIWSELASTYVGTDIEDNWDALFHTTALFRRVRPRSATLWAARTHKRWMMP